MDSSWKSRLENAEMTPPDALWANIESTLPASSSAKPWLFTTVGIAATVSLLFAASILGYWLLGGSTERSNTQISQSSEPKMETGGNEEQFFSEIEEDSVLEIPSVKKMESNSSVASTEASATQETVPSRGITREHKGLAQTTSTDIESAENESIPNVILEKNSEVATTSSESPSLQEEPSIDPQNILAPDSLSSKKVIAEVLHEPFEELPTLEDIFAKKENKKSASKNRLWAGVFQGVGGYASNISTPESANFASHTDGESFNLSDALMTEQSSTRSLDEKQLINTTLLVGVPMNDKFSLVSGVQYSKSSFGSTASSIDDQLLHFTAEVNTENLDGGSFQRTNLEGFYEMASIPLMADYNIISSRINWTVQAGPSIGLLLRQKIMSDELGLSQTTQPGDLYEPIHLRVTIGTSLSYSLGENYQISFRPAAEQAVTSITTSNASFSSYPFTYTISLGLRYQF